MFEARNYFSVWYLDTTPTLTLWNLATATHRNNSKASHTKNKGQIINHVINHGIIIKQEQNVRKSLVICMTQHVDGLLLKMLNNLK